MRIIDFWGITLAFSRGRLGAPFCAKMERSEMQKKACRVGRRLDCLDTY